MEQILDEQVNQNTDGYKACYNCEETNYTKVMYTWWGGILGPRMLNHVKCNVCGSYYNGKTGASNAAIIFIYSIILLAILITVLIMIFS